MHPRTSLRSRLLLAPLAASLACTVQPGDTDSETTATTPPSSDPSTTSDTGDLPTTGEPGETGETGETGSTGDPVPTTGETTDPTATGETTDTTTGDEPVYQPIVCPDPNPFSPGPNSVSVQGTLLQSDEHWTADNVYLIFDDFKVTHHVLTIDPGTVICMSNTAQLFVGDGGPDPGEIHINGTAEAPVTITSFASSMDPNLPDYPHRGIKFDTYQQSTISYLNVWYGGGAQWAFELTNTARDDESMEQPTKPLLLDHVTIGGVRSKGLRIGPEAGIDAASSITLTDFAPDPNSPAPDAVAELNYYAEKSVMAAFTYDKATIPPEAQKIRLVTSAPPLILDHDVEITDGGLPYYTEFGPLSIDAENDQSSATLTIGPGVTMHMRGLINVGDAHEGNLVINGTAERPVVLTSAEPTPGPGDWGGILFNVFDPTISKIEHAQILYGGLSNPMDTHVGRCGEDFQGTLMIFGTGMPYDGPAISDTEIAFSPSSGIVSNASDSMVQLSTDYADPALNITFHDIAGEDLVIGPCI